MSAQTETRAKNARLIEVKLDVASLKSRNANIEHERDVAIYDLLDENSFELDGHPGPYRLSLAILEDRLIFKVCNEAAELLESPAVSLSALRRIMKDYFIVLDSYYKAVRSAHSSRIEAIDVGRRGLHDEGSQVLIDKLAGKVAMDFDTARRLFSLIAALHWKG